LAGKKLEHLVARSMAELREERGWTQSDLAHQMKRFGVDWPLNRATQIETLRGKVTLYEVIALALVFEVPITRLFQGGGDDVEFPNGRGQIPLEKIRQVLEGQAVAITMDASEKPEDNEAELRRIAKKLGIPIPLLAYVSRRMWGHAYIVERDIRVGDLCSLTPRSLQARRGWASRQLLQELTAYLERVGIDRLLEECLREQERRRAEMLSQLPASPTRPAAQ